jgi:hypothetical protein
MKSLFMLGAVYLALTTLMYGGGGIVPGDYDITTFSIPNSGTLGVEQISDNKLIVGYLSVASGNPSSGPFQGFERLRNGGVVPIVNPADGTGTFTEALGLNNQGTIVGEFYNSAALRFSGFFYRGGSFATYDLPGLSPGSTTAIVGNNERGDFCGFYLDSSNFAILNSFIVNKNGQVTKFSLSPVTGFTEAIAMNNQGAVVGTYEDSSSVFHGFIRQPDGTVVTVTVPTATSAAGLGTTTLGVNESGWVSGHFWDASLVEHGYTRSPSGQFYQIDVPGATSTAGGGLNNEGIVVGHYNIGSAEYGYIATPK